MARDGSNRETAGLVQAEKLAGVGRMAAQLAHQLNTPLAAILLSAQALEESLAGTDQAADLKIIIDEARRCQLIVRRVQNFARAPGNREDRVNLCHLFHRVHRILGHRLEAAGVRLVFDIRRGRYMVSGDPTELEHVLFALIENALDVSPRGSEIRVEMWISYSAGRIWFRVLDQGPGIPTEVFPHLFEPFFTTKEEGKGTGLGLYIAKRILASHDGSISAGNRPGGGAEFELELPVSPLLLKAIEEDPGLLEIKAVPFEILSRRAAGDRSAGCEIVGILGAGRAPKEGSDP